jgi:hypothetical protein
MEFEYLQGKILGMKEKLKDSKKENI